MRLYHKNWPVLKSVVDGRPWNVLSHSRSRLQRSNHPDFTLVVLPKSSTEARKSASVDSLFIAHCYHVNWAVSVTGLVIQHDVSSGRTGDGSYVQSSTQAQQNEAPRRTEVCCAGRAQRLDLARLIKCWQYFQRSGIWRTTREQDVLRWVPGFLHCMGLGCSYLRMA